MANDDKRPVYSTATWKDHDDYGGSTYTWPQGTKDNRPSRVRRRMEIYGMDETADMATLRVQHHRVLSEKQFTDQPVTRTGGRSGPGTKDSSKIVVPTKKVDRNAPDFSVGSTAGARNGSDGLQGGRL